MHSTDDVAVITPTYSRDAASCAELNRSVLEFSSSWNHYILADRRDLKYFRHLDGARTKVVPKEDVMPRGFKRLPGSRFWLCPWTRKPLAGWLIQQIAKIAVAESLSEGAILSIDSDVLVVRDICTTDFVRDGKVRIYWQPGGITPDKKSHIRWHQNACRLLGVEPDHAPMTDFISPMVSWNRDLILSMCRRIEDVGERPWYESVARTPRFSEGLLYGAYVVKVLGDDAPVWFDEREGLLNYWETHPLDNSSAEDFLRKFKETDFAVMISSHSRTPESVRRMVAVRMTERRLT